MMTTIMLERNRPRTKNSSEFTIKLMVDFARASSLLVKKLKAMCTKVICAKRKSAKDAYFALLGYKPFFAPRGRAPDKKVERARQSQTWEAYNKLSRLDSTG